MLKKLLALTCLTLSIGANAAPVIWTLDNVEYTDGSTAVGSFTFDADKGTYSNTAIVLTCGGVCSGTLNNRDSGGFGGSDHYDLYYREGGGGFLEMRLFFDTSLTNAGGRVALRSLSYIFSTDNTEVAEVVAGVTVSAVPIPAAAWLFGSALIGLVAVKRKKG